MGYNENLDNIDRLVIRFNDNDKIGINREYIEDNNGRTMPIYILKPGYNTVINSDIPKNVKCIYMVDNIDISSDMATLSIRVLVNAEIEKIYYVLPDGNIDYNIDIMVPEPEDGIHTYDIPLLIANIKNIEVNKEFLSELLKEEFLIISNEDLKKYDLYVPQLKLVK